MAPGHSKRPRDANQLAKDVVDIATSSKTSDNPAQADHDKDAAAVNLGRKGGLKGGKARSEKLSPEERQRIARQAAAARWSDKDDG